MPHTLTRLRRRYPLHIQIAALFALLIIAIGSTIIIFSHYQLTKLTEHSTNRQYQKTAEAIAAELNSVTKTMMMSVNILADTKITEATTIEQRMALVSTFIDTLTQHDYASAVYSAYPNGDFFILRRITTDNRMLFDAPENTKWLVQIYRLIDSTPEKKYFYLDKAQTVILQKDIDYDNYDPRNRVWFTSALKRDDFITSPNYIFKGTGEMGFTYSRQAENKLAVIGLDVSFSLLSQFFQQQNLPLGSQAAIINFANEIIASEPLVKKNHPIKINDANKIENIPVLHALLNFHLKGSSINGHDSRIFEVGGEHWYGAVIDIHNNDYQLVIATPSAYLTADADAIRNNLTQITVVLFLLSLLLVWYLSLKISKPLIRLRQDADSISNLYFDEREVEHSIIEEVDDLHNSMSKMKMTLKQFISMGNILTAKGNFPQQMQELLKETTKISTMQGGVIFLADKEASCFSPIACCWHGESISSPEILPLMFDKNSPTSFGQVLEGKTVAGIFDNQTIPASLKLFFQNMLPLNYIAISMQTHDQQLMGFLLLLNSGEQNIEHQSAKIQLINALVGSLSVAIETQYLLQEQKNLLSAFIKLIAGAIDAKSAYTGGHCQRVPVITKMLAKAAIDVKDGPFADFSLSENEWEELHTACWLHDCGKITTPESVVDKATKLELIYNRIHEIRMRFELLKREREITHLRNAMIKNGCSLEKKPLADELRQLDNDFYFIAECNIGSEFLADEAIDRIQQISRYQWTRTLADTTGVSTEELMRKGRQPAVVLPVKEPMLADKEEHIIYRDDKNRQPDNYNFKLKEPKLLYNHGEIYNLCIRKGTLNEEERYKINEHIIQTIIMLETLPFPRTMANVAVIAGGHHERVDGKGYPYQLNAEQMSIPVRMIAIADVFEALTAFDRPYKSGKLLSDALKIMTNMVNEHHLDRELFILFLQSGVWHDYASIHLQPDNVDQVDVAELLQAISPELLILKG